MDSKKIFGDADNEGFVSFDEIENAFTRPTQYQDFYERPEPGPESSYTPSEEFPTHLTDPDGTADGNNEEEPVVDHGHAQRTGERIARLIDTGIDFALSNFVARNGKTYRADERDLQDIADAWGEVSEEHQWNIGPEWTLAILYVMVYGPLAKQAVTDRRMAELEARQQQLEDRMKVFENQQNSHGGIDTNPTPGVHNPE